MAQLDYTAGRIRDRLAELLAEVADVGVIHRHRRNNKDWGQFLQLFHAMPNNGRTVIRGWTITRQGVAGIVGLTAEIPQLFAFGTQSRPYIFLLEGISSLEDNTASELEWERIVEAVMDKLDAQTDLGLPDIVMAEGVLPAQLQQWEEREFGNVTCHYAALLLPVLAPRSVA